MKKMQIVEARFWYGPKTTYSRLLDDEGENVWEGTRSEAIEKIKQLNSGIYYLSHNEYSRPHYNPTYRLK